MTNPPSELKVACVQLTSGIDLEYNRQQVEVALQEAVENEAQWIVLPEAVNLLQQKNPLARAAAVAAGPSRRPRLARCHTRAHRSAQ